MSVIVCPPTSSPALDPSWPVPSSGFGSTELYRNGVLIWFDLWGAWYDGEPWTVGQLTEWCPVRRGVGWKLVVNGPLKTETYRLRKGEWALTERGEGFA